MDEDFTLAVSEINDIVNQDNVTPEIETRFRSVNPIMYNRVLNLYFGDDPKYEDSKVEIRDIIDQKKQSYLKILHLLILY